MEDIKNEMEAYWTRRVKNFSALREREFVGEKHEQWLTELKKHIPMETPLDILDIGTGTGFFAFLLAENGHRMTGIDLTPDMIREAKEMAARHRFPIHFFIMDAESPDFPPHSFDAIVTRKLTWTLPHLPAAYQAWHRLLKPGGILLNFDADYCRETAAYDRLSQHAHQDVDAALMQEYEKMKNILRPTQMPRPHWDSLLLQEAGFSHIAVDTTVSKRIYTTIDEFYDPTPVFSIFARA